MFTQYLTKEEVNALDPEKLCVAYGSGDGDLYTSTGADLLEDSAPGTTLTEALDSLLEHKRRDDFEILMVNSAGQIVQLQPKD